MEKNKKIKMIELIKDNKDKIIELSFLFILIISLLFIFKDFILAKIYYMYGDAGSDTIDQYFPYYINEILGIKNGNLSVWNFNYGLGTSIFNTSLWTFDIFAILLVLESLIFGVGKVHYLLVWMQIFKIIVIYILSKKYMSYFLKNKFALCLASYLSAMNGYIFLWGQHYFFGTAYFYMILLLCAIEYFLAEKNKKSIIYLALTTASVLIFGYYIAYMVLLVSAIYFIFRYLYITEKVKIKEMCKDFGKCIHGVVTGILLSGTVLLPACYHVITTSSRLVGAEQNIISKLFNAFTSSFNFEYINIRLNRLISNNINKQYLLQNGFYYELPQLFCTIFILFFLIQWIIYDFKKCKTKKDYTFFTLKIVALYFLIFNNVSGLILNGFVETKYRYTYVILPFLALIVGIVWEKIIIKNKINIWGLLLSTILTFGIFYSSVKEVSGMGIRSIITYGALLFLIIGFLTLFLINKRNKYANIFIYCFLAIVLVNTCFDDFITTKYRKFVIANSYTLTWDNQFNLKNDTGKAIKFIKENDKSFYRIEKNYIDFSLLGDTFIEQNSSVVWYNSTINPNINAFYKNIYPNANKGSFKAFSLEDAYDSQALYLTNSKYILSKQPLDIKILEEINKIGEVYIYKNINTNSIAKWYNQTISEDEYMELSEEEKSEKLYNYAIVNENLDIVENSKAIVSEFNLVSQTKISGEVTTDNSGLLMVAIPNEEGWNAYIDNDLVDTYKVDYGFIGIVVPEGKHDIEIRYTTPKMKEGIILSLTGLVSLIVIFFVYNNKKISDM